jgi:hypothetical protein
MESAGGAIAFEPTRHWLDGMPLVGLGPGGNKASKQARILTQIARRRRLSHRFAQRIITSRGRHFGLDPILY